MAENSNPLSPEDKMNIYTLGRIRAMETVLMLLWNSHPDRETVKADSLYWAEAVEAIGLHSDQTDEEMRVRKVAYQQTFDAIFAELPPEAANAPARKP
jgi:hypothetical protein